MERVRFYKHRQLTYLNDSRFIENCIPRWLITLHVPQDTTYAKIVRVDQTKGSDIDKIVLEVLQVEGFDILWRSRASESNRESSGSSTMRFNIPRVLTKVVKR